MRNKANVINTIPPTLAWTRVVCLIISTPIWLILLSLKGKFKRISI